MSVNRVEVVDRTERYCLILTLLSCKSLMSEKENSNRKKCTLRELRQRDFLGILVVEYICYIFLTVREAAFAENYTLTFCGVTNSEMWQGKPRGAMASEKPIYRWHLDLIAKGLRCNNCLNTWATNCATFWNQKLCCVTVFLHKNDETKNSSGLHSTTKNTFFV